MRNVVADAMKGLASLFIMMHHISIYGPSGAWLSKTAPTIHSLLSDSRILVHAFLAISGWLIMDSRIGLLKKPWISILHRYVSLTGPFIIACLFSAFMGWLAFHFVGPMGFEIDFSIIEWSHLFAHTTLTNSILESQSLVAGAWYIPIDFQLFGVFILLSKLLEEKESAFIAALTILVCSSVFYFNVFGSDIWWTFFMGSFGLGALFRKIQDLPLKQKLYLSSILSIIIFGALSFAFRSRLLVAYVVSMILCFAPPNLSVFDNAFYRKLSNISFSIFLTHFSILEIVSAIDLYFFHDAYNGIFAFFITPILSIPVAIAYNIYVEKRFRDIASRLK